jgi:hypothetical protein
MMLDLLYRVLPIDQSSLAKIANIIGGVFSSGTESTVKVIDKFGHALVVWLSVIGEEQLNLPRAKKRWRIIMRLSVSDVKSRFYQSTSLVFLGSFAN